MNFYFPNPQPAVLAFPKSQAVKHEDELAERTAPPSPPKFAGPEPDASMAPPEAEVAAAAGDVEEAAAPLIPGPGARRATAAATPRDVHLLSSAFLFVFLAYHAAQNLQSTVNTVRAPPPTLREPS